MNGDNNMKDGQTFLLLRYSNKPVSNCIQLHIEIIEKLGYCWFGKIGDIPSDHILSMAFREDKPILVLYRKNDSYICKMTEYSLNKDHVGYPQYYYDEGISPSISFRLNSIEPCKNELFHNSIVISTGAYVEDAMYHSRISYMLCSYVDENKQPKLDEDDCRYKKDGICICRTCVNYDCICDRPKACVKQRR